MTRHTAAGYGIIAGIFLSASLALFAWACVTLADSSPLVFCAGVAPCFLMVFLVWLFISRLESETLRADGETDDD